MGQWLVREFSGRGFGVLLGLFVGTVITWLVGRWKRRRQRLRILTGDARDTVVIHQHLVERCEGSPPRFRIRTVGQGELARVVPNDHLADVLRRRATGVTALDTLISMESAEGSYLLETLTNFVCDRVANAPFEHELYVMAPCCEPAAVATHQPITILLVRVADLALFESWPECRAIQVEHGSDGIRLLTLRALARRYRTEQALLAEMRKSGQRTRHVETMYILDLPLDRRSAALPTRPVPWERFASVLAGLNLECPSDEGVRPAARLDPPADASPATARSPASRPRSGRSAPPVGSGGG
jgi:hypothetical protein